MNKGGKSSARADAGARAPHAQLRHRPRVFVRARLPAGSAARTSRRPSTSSAASSRSIPATEIVLYTYTPVPLDGSLYTEAKRLGFAFPETLEQWASPEWEQLSMRRGDGIPWMDRSTGGIRRRVRNFERVINAFYPTVTDLRLTGWRRAALKAASGLALRPEVVRRAVRAARAEPPDSVPAAGDDGVLSVMLPARDAYELWADTVSAGGAQPADARRAGRRRAAARAASARRARSTSAPDRDATCRC